VDATASHHKPQPAFCFSAYVRETAKECNWIYQDTVDRLVADLEYNIDLRRSIVEEATAFLLQHRANDVIQARRRMVVHRAINASGKANVIALGEAFASSLYNFPLRGGKLLINASRDEILTDAAHRRRLGSTMLHEASFLERVGAAMTDGRSVKEIFTPEQLQPIWNEAND
jgi:hypothetical protein